MANNQASADDLSYRKRSVDETLRDHEQRLTANERRWLVSKGALGMLAAIKGINYGIDGVTALI